MAKLVILTPVHRDMHPATRESIENLILANWDVQPVTVSGISCVVQARIAVASRAVQLKLIDDETDVLWLDSDMVFTPDTILRHMSALHTLYQCRGITAVAGLCVKRTRPTELALWRDLARSEFECEGETVTPVFAGMACLAMMGSEFMRIVDESPAQLDGDGAVIRNIICSTRVKYDNKKGPQLVSEDFDYCSRIKGGVWAVQGVRYGHMVEQCAYP